MYGCARGRGYDAGKKVNRTQAAYLGRYIRIVANSDGDYGSYAGSRRCAVVAEQSAGRARNCEKYGWTVGTRGKLVDWVTERFAFCLAVVLRPKERKGFVLLPRRWVVERTFGWLNHSRRLSKSYERLTQTDESWIYIAMTRIMLDALGLSAKFPNSC